MKIEPEESRADQETVADERLQAALEAYERGDEGIPMEDVFRRLRGDAAARKRVKSVHAGQGSHG